ncbi:type III-A CRISPR-associated protein Csm2 [Neomoorella thermoacetica]|uniref:type III-A CRISPR-associated protein Csm2 n=1 Tax=Neomoorella thermoacetica TaxID=1525 RepID=UPI0030D6066C
MPENNLMAILKGKPLVDQAVWYRVLKLYDLNKRRWTRSAAEKCGEYLVNYDNNLVNYAENYRGQKRDWDKELDNLKDAIIKQGIVVKLQGFNCLAVIPAEDMVAWARALGALLAVELKTAQIRRFLGAILEAEVEVKKEKPEDFTKDQAAYLKVYLAYATGRNAAVLPLLTVIEPMIDLVRPRGREGWEDFNELVRFVRAVVAYHKFYGGTEYSKGR